MKPSPVAIVRESVTWAFAGAFYGAYFFSLLAYLHIHDWGHWSALLLSSSLAGMIIAAFFGSMLVALGGTLTGILTAISHLIFFNNLHPGIMLGAAFVAGLAAGSFFTKRELRQSQPMAQATSGFAAGLLSAPVLALLTSHMHPAPGFWLISTLSVMLVGIGYIGFIKIQPASFRKGHAVSIGGPLVCALIATAVASAFWVIGESSMSIPQQLAMQQNIYQPVLDNAINGLLGGALGGAIGGAMLELIGIDLEEHIR